MLGKKLKQSDQSKVLACIKKIQEENRNKEVSFGQILNFLEDDENKFTSVYDLGNNTKPIVRLVRDFFSSYIDDSYAMIAEMLTVVDTPRSDRTRQVVLTRTVGEELEFALISIYAREELKTKHFLLTFTDVPGKPAVKTTRTIKKLRNSRDPYMPYPDPHWMGPA